MMFRPLPVLSLFTAISLVILILLGNWQWERYSQKIDRQNAGPVSWESAAISSDFPTPFKVRTVLNGKPVWKIILPIRIDGGATSYSVIELIEGNDPPALMAPESYPIVGQTVEGIYTKPIGPSTFTIDPDVEARTWFAFDEPHISEVSGYPPPADKRLFEPVKLKYTDANGLARLMRNPFADYYQGDSLPPQRHFGYAITWWGLAIALFVIYLVFHQSQGRLRFRKSS